MNQEWVTDELQKDAGWDGEAEEGRAVLLSSRKQRRVTTIAASGLRLGADASS